MTPHKKSTWLEGGYACLECSEDWPCRDMRIWQSGYRAGLEEIKELCGVAVRGLSSPPATYAGKIGSDALLDLMDELDAKLKE